MEDVIPYLEQIAGPGSRVIFLVHYSVEGLDSFQSKLTASVIKEQKLMTEKNNFALEPLRERDVTVALDIYAGPLRKVVKQYTLFQNCLLFLNFSCLSKSSSVHLLRPDISEREQ